MFGKIARGLVRGPSVRENEGKEEVCAWAWAEFLWADVIILICSSALPLPPPQNDMKDSESYLPIKSLDNNN